MPGRRRSSPGRAGQAGCGQRGARDMERECQMAAEQTDIVVIGMGPGGEDAAGKLAQAGLHVTGVEAKLVGGECPYWGCVPSKMMIRAANLLAEGRRIPGMAGGSTVTADWAPVAARIRDEATDTWDDKVAVDRFTGKGGHFVRGRGRITGRGEVTVDTPDGERVLRARRGVLLDIGTEPAIPPVPGLAGTPYWTNREAVETEHVPGSLIVLGGGETLTAQRLLVATGRRADLAALGIGVYGIDETCPIIAVDEQMRAAGGLWAIGDITGKGAFTHVSMYQAAIATHDILGQQGPAADYRAVPRVTFTDPEIGSVGLIEGQARDQGLAVRTGITQVPSSARGWIHKAGNDGFIKLIEDTERGVLVGATSAGPAGGEVLGALVVAVHGQVPVADLRTMIYAYPTFHRAIEAALDDLAGE